VRSRTGRVSKGQRHPAADAQQGGDEITRAGVGVLEVFQYQANDASVAICTIRTVGRQPLDDAEQALLHARAHLVGRLWSLFGWLGQRIESVGQVGQQARHVGRRSTENSAQPVIGQSGQDAAQRVGQRRVSQPRPRDVCASAAHHHFRHSG
jgi:hypothetical protein